MNLEPRDNNYLRLQFTNKMYTKYGEEFQNFFVDIMLKVFPNFIKIRPYPGDKGNDGYFHTEGIYYQLYSPLEPEKKISDAAKKLEKDFETLKNNWDTTSTIKEYYFVYNDKYLGTIPKLRNSLSNLEKKYPDIKFAIKTSTDLEDLFFKLNRSDLLSLGFDIDSTKAFAVVSDILKNLEIYLDRENCKLLQQYLISLEPIVKNLPDDYLILQFHLFGARLAQKLGKLSDAIEGFEKLIILYPKDAQAYLYLAGIYLEMGNLEKNNSLLEQAEQFIGSDGEWQLKFEQLRRNIETEKNIDLGNISSHELYNNPLIDAKFYYLYSYSAYQNKNYCSALSMVERAILHNPDKVQYYVFKLSILWDNIAVNLEEKDLKENLLSYLKQIQQVKDIILKFDTSHPRTLALLSYYQMIVYYDLKNPAEIEKYFISMLRYIFESPLDSTIEKLLCYSLKILPIPLKEFNDLLGYLLNTDSKISNELAKIIIIGFIEHNKLLTDESKHFFYTKKCDYAINFLKQIENKNFTDICGILSNDITFAAFLAANVNIDSDLRKEIINNILPATFKDKKILLFQYYYDTNDYDAAFEIIKDLDFTTLSIIQCDQIYIVAKNKEAWETVIDILRILATSSINKQTDYNVKLGLMQAHFKLGNFLEVTKIGESILIDSKENNLLSSENIESVIHNTTIAFINRNEPSKALNFLEAYCPTQPTYTFKLNFMVHIYLKNNLPQKALDALISGVASKGYMSDEDYASLYESSINIENLLKIHTLPVMNRVMDNCFVKLCNEDKWFYIGEGVGLDATCIDKNDQRYLLFINRTCGDRIILNPYINDNNEEKPIEQILTIDYYILWKIDYCFKQLASTGRLKNAITIQIDNNDGTIDLTNLKNCVENIQKPYEPFFEQYCSNMFPLTLLAINNGGLLNAINKIVNSQKGFIHCSLGTPEELQQQNEIAKKLITGSEFYLDATSAFVLAESEILPTLLPHLPGLKIPQSVINFINNIINQFSSAPGQVGRGGYSEGKFYFFEINKEEESKYLARYHNFLNLLDDNKKIKSIAFASKYDSFIEQDVAAELTDACVLAQKDGVSILTEDILYLTANSLLTKKESPSYCSSIILVRTLYDLRKINFETYLNFFSYLSQYRFRFLQVRIEDIEKAILGAGILNIFEPNNIKKLNFKLTLSEEYGVQFNTAFSIITQFLLKAIYDDTMLPNNLDKIFLELVEEFPTKFSKQTLAKMMLEVCRRTLYNSSNLIITDIKKVENKINRLYSLTNIYEAHNKTHLLS